MQLDQLTSLITDLRRRPLHCGEASSRSLDYGGDIIERILPHRAPFRLIDAIEAVDLSERTARGRRLIRSDDAVFAGHLPGAPSYPGVLQIEVMGQLGLCLAYLARQNSVEVGPKATLVQARMLKIHYAACVTPVRPGAHLEVHAAIVEQDELTAVVAGQLIREDVIEALAVQELYLEK